VLTGVKAANDGVRVLAGTEEGEDPILVRNVVIDLVGSTVVIYQVWQCRQIIVRDITIGGGREIRLEGLRDF